MERSQGRRAALLRELEYSGLSMAEFCRQRSLTYATVAGWRSMARSKATRFVEVETGAEPPALEGAPRGGAGLCAELVLPGGVVLRVYHHAGAGGAA